MANEPRQEEAEGGAPGEVFQQRTSPFKGPEAGPCSAQEEQGEACVELGAGLQALVWRKTVGWVSSPGGGWQGGEGGLGILNRQWSRQDHC